MSKIATPFNSPKVLLARLTRLTSSNPGLDASLMIAQYSSPLVIAFLLGLAKFRTAHPRLSTIKVPAGAGLIRLAEGWAKAGASVGDARVIMRAFGQSRIPRAIMCKLRISDRLVLTLELGLLPIVQFLFALHPNPLASLSSLLNVSRIPTYLSSPKALPTMQILALLTYYPLEHVAWLGSKGVIPLTVRQMGIAQLFSVRAWA